MSLQAAMSEAKFIINKIRFRRHDLKALPNPSLFRVWLSRRLPFMLFSFAMQFRFRKRAQQKTLMSVSNDELSKNGLDAAYKYNLSVTSAKMSTTRRFELTYRIIQALGIYPDSRLLVIGCRTIHEL